jgi:hypothetical protein
MKSYQKIINITLTTICGGMLILILSLSDIVTLLNTPINVPNILEIIPSPLSSTQWESKIKFYAEAKNRGLDLQDLPIYKVSSTVFLFGHLLPTIDPEFNGSKMEGVCLRYAWPKIIVISENADMSAIFHEFGHCLLNRKHTTALLPNGLPQSLMYPESHSLLNYDYNYYVNELFSN